MKKKEKIVQTWTALICIMNQENFEPSRIALVNHEGTQIAVIDGIPTYKEMESEDFHLCEWLVDGGHIDVATLEELADIFKDTRYIVCNDVEDITAMWQVRVTKFRGGNPWIAKYSMDSAGKKLVQRDRFMLYRCG